MFEKGDSKVSITNIVLQSGKRCPEMGTATVSYQITDRLLAGNPDEELVTLWGDWISGCSTNPGLAG